jgi:hypothetical protein
MFLCQRCKAGASREMMEVMFFGFGFGFGISLVLVLFSV